MSRRPPKGEVERPPPRNPMVPWRASSRRPSSRSETVRPPSNPALVGGLAQDEWQAYADAHREGVEVHDEMHVINFRASPDRDQPPERDQPPVPPMAHEEVVATPKKTTIRRNDDDEDDLLDVTADAEGLFKCKQCENRLHRTPQRLGSPCAPYAPTLSSNTSARCASAARRRPPPATNTSSKDHGLERDDKTTRKEEGQLSKEMLDHIQATSTKPLRNSKRIKEEPREDGERSRVPRPADVLYYDMEKTLCEKKGAGHGSLSFEDLVSILAATPRQAHRRHRGHRRSWAVDPGDLGQAPHVDLF
ncbi:hypothetical protein M3Y99_00712900 [Aphelenchoides fujianensis]|nr:hypothetical protein M3Y99_00712900 [Aphelenchoides fujianensis]